MVLQAMDCKETRACKDACQLASSRKLEREAGRNVELMWSTGKLAPNFKTVTDFRRDTAKAIKAACQRFVLVCRTPGLVGGGVVAIIGSRLRAVNAHAKNDTKGKGLGCTSLKSASIWLGATSDG